MQMVEKGEVTTVSASPQKKKFKFNRQTLSYLSGYLYVTPVLLGILLFTLIPMIISLIQSFSYYNPAEFRSTVEYSTHYYKLMFTDDRTAVLRSLFITIRYAVVMVPLSLCGSFFVAVLLSYVKNKNVNNVLTVLLYLPALIPGVAGSLLWANITSTESWGYINQILSLLGLEEYAFFADPNTVFPTIILLSLNGWGTASIMWTAQMKNIPKDMYEAAQIDGAGRFQQLVRITIPLCTPMLFYLLITNIIGALQIFGNYYAMLTEYPQSATELQFFVVKIYREIYYGYGTSYACALSWILFLIIGVLTFFVFKNSSWVYYSEEK